MSFSIREGVEESTTRLKAEKKIAELYPDAYLSSLRDGRKVWMSEKVEPTDVDVSVDDKGDAWLIGYVPVEGMRVFHPHCRCPMLVVLANLREREPKAYNALIRAARFG